MACNSQAIVLGASLGNEGTEGPAPVTKQSAEKSSGSKHGARGLEDQKAKMNRCFASVFKCCKGIDEKKHKS